MRIGLNATCFDDRPSGANQRFRLLYGAVIRRNPQHQFLIYEPADHRIAGWFADCTNVTARVTPVRGAGRLTRLATGLRYWRTAFRADALDVFETFSLPLVAAPCPTILTVHDLRSLQVESRVARAIARMVLRHAFARADRIVSVSAVVRDEIAAFRPGTQVSVVHNGVARSAAASCDALPTGLPDRFALAVGHLETRKNLPLLIDAIGRLRDSGAMRPLVLAGRDGGVRDQLRGHIAARDLGTVVHIVEDADDATIRALYAACALVVVPSSYEGFGIALIEAMAAGRPLVTSDIAVFREVTQGQGCYFAVDDPAAAAAAIDRVWTDDTERARLIGYGDMRVGDFAFDALADRIAALYTPSAAASRARAAATEWNRS